LVENFNKNNLYAQKNTDEYLKRILDSDLMLNINRKKLILFESFQEELNTSKHITNDTNNTNNKSLKKNFKSLKQVHTLIGNCFKIKIDLYYLTIESLDQLYNVRLEKVVDLTDTIDQDTEAVSSDLWSNSDETISISDKQTIVSNLNSIGIIRYQIMHK